MALSGQIFALCSLTFRSSRLLGDLPVPSAVGPVDVEIVWTPHLALPRGELAFTTSAGDGVLRVFREAEGWLWVYPDGVNIVVSAAGHRVECSIPDHYDITDVATYLLGPILGFLLRMRGIPALHATTVAVNGRTIALAGPAGAGKSTLAAELVRRGHALVAEDVSALRRRRGGEFEVLPGLNFIKLWEDSAARHGDLPRLTPNWDKRYLTTSTVPSPALDAVYFLAGGEVGVRSLRARDGAIALLDNVYLSYALTAADRENDLELFSAAAATLALFELSRPDDFGQLTALCELIESGP